jgi:hypothetical protein
MEPDSANRRRFLQLCPISPLSTGSTPHFSLSRLGRQVHGAWVIGTAVPASPKGRKRHEGAAGDQRSDLRRQDWEEPSGSYRASREEAPEESSSSSATRLPDLLVGFGERSGTQEGSTQEGPQNIGRFWFRETPVSEAGPGRSKDQRTFGPRSLVDRSGSSKEGAVRWKATPELVSQDRERVRLGRKVEVDQVTNTGRSFARRSGGWQQCRPPFLLGIPRSADEPGRLIGRGSSYRLRRRPSPGRVLTFD